MADLEKLHKSRASARGWLTRSSKGIKALLDKPNSDLSCIELEDALDEFDKRMSTLDDLQSSYKLEIAVLVN